MQDLLILVKYPSLNGSRCDTINSRCSFAAIYSFNTNLALKLILCNLEKILCETNSASHSNNYTDIDPDKHSTGHNEAYAFVVCFA